MAVTPHSAVIAGLACVWLLQGGAWAGPAIGQFEIKALGAEPGGIEFQSQNDVSLGNPCRSVGAGEDGGAVMDTNSLTRQRHGLEMEVGWSSFFKTRLGLEYSREQPETSASGGYESLKLEGFGLEGIVTLVPRTVAHPGLGILTEIDVPRNSEEAKTLTVGPIIEAEFGGLLLSFNPTIVRYFGGERNDDGKRDDKLDVWYTARVKYTFQPGIVAAIEAFGSIDRLGHTGHRDEADRMFGDHNQLRVGPVAYWSWDLPSAIAKREDDEGSKATLGLGYLFGLTDATPNGTLKLSFEVEY